MLGKMIDRLSGWEEISYHSAPTWVKRSTKRGVDSKFSGRDYDYKVSWNKEKFTYNANHDMQCARWVTGTRLSATIKRKSKR